MFLTAAERDRAPILLKPVDHDNCENNAARKFHAILVALGLGRVIYQEEGVRGGGGYTTNFFIWHTELLYDLDLAIIPEMPLHTRAT